MSKLKNKRPTTTRIKPMKTQRRKRERNERVPREGMA
jgi:hypothetical protein